MIKVRRIAGWFAVLVVLLVVTTGCASTVGDRAEKGEVEAFEHNRRYLVGVLSFEDTTGEMLLREMQDSFSGLLISRLQDHGRYRLIEKERIDSLLAEQSFQMSGAVGADNIQEVGNMLGVEALCITSIDYLNYSEEKTSAFIAWIDKQRAEVGVSSRIVSVATGEILATAETVAKRGRNRHVAFWLLKKGSFLDKSALINEAMNVAVGNLAFSLSEKAVRK
ncbi:MAG TPA: hypothetical protein ENN41_04350 [Sediminispirochaeta sp.]|nr:hypothetical protein [Sediminispirochaeta sp.]